jgi:hypothetical protein
MFDIGQEVVVVKSSHAKRGARGVVAAIDEDKRKHTVGVFFLKSVRGGHDLDGNCPDGFGRWMSEDQLIALS